MKPYYQELKFLKVGVTTYESQGVNIKIFDKNRTICDVLRYEKKLGKEIYSNAIRKYIQDPTKSIQLLFKYAKIFNITHKVQTQIGIWLP